MKKKTKIPQIKKDLKIFLQSEEGKIVEKNAVKLGLALVATAGIISGIAKTDGVQATCQHSSGGDGSNGCFISGCW